MRRTARRGSTIVEFTLAGIPVIFALISIFEISRGMWQYHTLAHAVTEGTRFVVVHGRGCDDAGCRVTVGQIARRISRAGPGILPEDIELELEPHTGPVIRCRLDECMNRGDVWPPDPAAAPGSRVTIRAVYNISSVLLMLNPAGKAGGANVFRMPASSTEMIQF
jgi:hypothetical protein